MTTEPNESAARVVEEKIDAAREAAAGRMGRVKEAVGDVADNVRARAAALREKIRETEWDDVTDNVGNYVRSNPGKSVAIALGVGFVLGFLLRRRDND